ncbi:uncharacterized protein Dana_GF10317 [Drosophila ananassae]|uniref:Protein arginine N-methyltransferase 6 n=1 Tax=Drosophila ananassae TaxID=7217 RepID=B3M952_DROAN|nr:protein arginine N-methyltransferase 1 [Drosophila ananassae]EDV40036.1 uncharacterized protein Dana_GF10317 [Drosophila ananassae]
MHGSKNSKQNKSAKKPVKLSLASFHNLFETKTPGNKRENSYKGKMNSQKRENVPIWDSPGSPIKGSCGSDAFLNQVLTAPAVVPPKVLAESSNLPKEPVKKADAKDNPEPKIILLRRPTSVPLRDRPKTKVRPCPRIPTPTRTMAKELEQVDLMTSADFRHDYSAHLENMRTRQQNQQHMHFFSSAFQQNRHLFKGRVILVICCGTGTLALMAARAGAKRVYAVDYSKVTCYAELVVKENHCEDVIKVLNGRMADLMLPEKVDGIVCNWMGHCLLYESEVLEVIAARDRWLKRGGFILPDRGSLFILGSEENLLKNDRCNWWLSVYGFNMKAMRRYALAEPRYAKTSGQKILTLAHRVLELDLMTANKEDIFVDRKIRLKVNREGYLECFLLYFDVEFSFSHTPLRMSCNPCLKSTHKFLWQQTVLFVEHPFVMRSNLHYAGYLKFSPLKPDSFKEMEVRIDFFQCNRYDEDLASDYCLKLVAKKWLMLEHFQTVSEVDGCQEETPGVENF